MSRTSVASLLTVALVLMAAPSFADRYHRGTDDNPFKLVAYALHPIGIAGEYFVLRPIHWFVSQGDNDILFGHKSSPVDDPTYFEWTHGDFSLSIANEAEPAPAAEPAQ